MERKKLGDSYDAVKRMWRDFLWNDSPLYADPRFIPADLQSDFTRLTGITILPCKIMMQGQYSILNDPDTGIRLPSGKNQGVGRTHTTINEIVGQLRDGQVKCVVTFDMGHDRNGKKSGNRRRQQQEKVRDLKRKKCTGFYYDSHAPFLFAAKLPETIKQIRKILVRSGIPVKMMPLP